MTQADSALTLGRSLVAAPKCKGCQRLVRQLEAAQGSNPSEETDARVLLRRHVRKVHPDLAGSNDQPG